MLYFSQKIWEDPLGLLGCYLRSLCFSVHRTGSSKYLRSLQVLLECVKSQTARDWANHTNNVSYFALEKKCVLLA
jgi:hypothetical protein